MAPERVRIAEAQSITGKSKRSLQTMARQGKIPGAAKLGGEWTFDLKRLRKWIRDSEVKPTLVADDRRPYAVTRSPSPELARAYEQLLERRRRNRSRKGKIDI